MANYSSLLSQINTNIKTNGTGAITGQLLQTILDAMVASLGAGYQYAGIAIPTTNPGTPDQNVFYIAATPGTYTNFGNIVVADGECVVLKGTGSTWSKEVTGAATADQVSQLGQENNGDYFKMLSQFNEVSSDTVATVTTGAKMSQVALEANKSYVVYIKGNISAFSEIAPVLYYRHVVSGTAVFDNLLSLSGAELLNGYYVKFTPEYDGNLSVRSYTENDSIYVAAVEQSIDSISSMLLNEEYSEVGTITYNEHNAIQTFNVKWSDGTSGVYTSTNWDADNNMYKGYTVTYGDSLILTQPAVTVVEGVVTSVPQKTISEQN